MPYESLREFLTRLEAAIEAIAPGKMPPLTEDEEDAEPFTLDSVGSHIQFCLERMRAHQSVRARQMVAIGELTTRVLSLGAHLSEETPPEIGEAAHAAMKKAMRQPPSA